MTPEIDNQMQELAKNIFGCLFIASGLPDAHSGTKADIKQLVQEMLQSVDKINEALKNR